MREEIILVHGYNKNEKDMLPLMNNLKEFGLNVRTINLPITFSNFNYCAELFAYKIKRILEDTKIEKLHLIGHSTGGLIIKKFIEDTKLTNIGKCILIATPNKGTKLANITKDYLPFVVKIFKPIDALIEGNQKILEPKNIPTPEIGCIIGRKNNLALGVFLSKESDGRVEVESAKNNIMKDFIILNYGHKKIHHKKEVAKYIHNFIKHGKFKN